MYIYCIRQLNAVYKKRLDYVGDRALHCKPTDDPVEIQAVSILGGFQHRVFLCFLLVARPDVRTYNQRIYLVVVPLDVAVIP